MKVVHSARETGVWCDRFRAAGLSVGFVPTMGCLHEGHLMLVRRARRECDRVVVSIFVNPTQFGPGEDLDSYPVTTEQDLAALEEAAVDLVLLGSRDEMYGEGFQTWVSVEHMTRPLCGASRPGHFRGVTTVVAQLLHIVKPHRAYFGLKDYQQARVVERMADDLHIDTEIVACETVRESDGLARSSRNRYLSPEARAVAPRIHRALVRARDLALGGESSVERLRAALVRELAPGEDLELDYAEVLDAETLETYADGVARREGAGILLAVAARVGNARLIDNVVVPPIDEDAS